jgi:hypothetical protein
MDQFVKAGNWFDKKYREKSSHRYFTFKTALNLFKQLGGQNIVETGTTRFKDDWGAGMSTVLFADFLVNENKEGHLWTVDILPEAITAAKEVTRDFLEVITYEIDDSLHFLKNFNEKIDLLYLDSFDFPISPFVDILGSIEKAMEVPEKEILEKFGQVINVCQTHQLKELKLALPKMDGHGIVLLDDNELPGQGKARLSKQHLETLGATCLFDSQQSLWLL